MPQTAPTILVIDDEEMILNFVGLVLKKAGFRVLSASSGKAALKLCQNGAEPLDLALLDIVMPEMDGPQVAFGLRSLYPALRILFMSGYTEEEISRRCGDIPGAADLLKKPFTASELLNRINRLIGRPVTQAV
jgi:two-component system cell cycle sensor histidine kinase/response regulator CckA